MLGLLILKLLALSQVAAAAVLPSTQDHGDLIEERHWKPKLAPGIIMPNEPQQDWPSVQKRHWKPHLAPGPTIPITPYEDIFRARAAEAKTIAERHWSPTLSPGPIIEQATPAADQGIHLTREAGQPSWFANVQIGEQTVQTTIDTNSHVLIIQPDVYTPGPTSHNLNEHEEFRFGYGTFQEDLIIDLYTDVINFGEGQVEAQDVKFGSVPKGKPRSKLLGPGQAVAGLAPTGPYDAQPSFVGEIFKKSSTSGGWKSGIFSLDLHPRTGVLSFEDPSTAADKPYQAPLVWAPIEGLYGAWLIKGNMNKSPFTFFLDSASEDILLHPTTFHDLRTKLGLTLKNDTQAGLLRMTGDCSSTHQVQFDFSGAKGAAEGQDGDVSFTLPKEIFWSGSKSSDLPEGTCVSSIAGISGSHHDPTEIILGGAFFLQAFVAFDVARNRIGLAAKAE